MKRLHFSCASHTWKVWLACIFGPESMLSFRAALRNKTLTIFFLKILPCRAAQSSVRWAGEHLWTSACHKTSVRFRSGLWLHHFCCMKTWKSWKNKSKKDKRKKPKKTTGNRELKPKLWLWVLLLNRHIQNSVEGKGSPQHDTATTKSGSVRGGLLVFCHWQHFVTLLKWFFCQNIFLFIFWQKKDIILFYFTSFYLGIADQKVAEYKFMFYLQNFSSSHTTFMLYFMLVGHKHTQQMEVVAKWLHVQKSEGLCVALPGADRQRGISRLDRGVGLYYSKHQQII